MTINDFHYLNDRIKKRFKENLVWKIAD